MNMKINSDNVSNNYQTTINNAEKNESVIDKNKLYKDIEPSLSKLTGI
ncbi:hypothetical protein [Proteus mirabilis]|nr:hypothetical protein [Proteus mirabilis]MDX4948875.1 hypothetical protein [Proteus mirabilis]